MQLLKSMSLCLQSALKGALNSILAYWTDLSKSTQKDFFFVIWLKAMQHKSRAFEPFEVSRRLRGFLAAERQKSWGANWLILECASIVSSISVKSLSNKQPD